MPSSSCSVDGAAGTRHALLLAVDLKLAELARSAAGAVTSGPAGADGTVSALQNRRSRFGTGGDVLPSSIATA
jgi:hypothetical protein